ncbi:hypothetical protein OA07_20395 [Aphanizomenon flos-aquae 2012/KM1/D3]|nr:hypothetical protein OA07_20395 [Aphanizomenon flos-aquae 2012/KM1/D3]MTJ30485.1 hypothetical protein [Aphanizomenon sp. UHCC 0183]
MEEEKQFYHLQKSFKIFHNPYRDVLSNWTKIFTVIASEGKQSQPLRLLHFTSFRFPPKALGD